MMISLTNEIIYFSVLAKEPQINENNKKSSLWAHNLRQGL